MSNFFEREEVMRKTCVLTGRAQVVMKGDIRSLVRMVSERSLDFRRERKAAGGELLNSLCWFLEV